MGVRRISVSPMLVEVFLQSGCAGPAWPVQPLKDAEVLEIRMLRPAGSPVIELLVESSTFDGPGSSGNWPRIAEGNWDMFPEHLVLMRAKPPAEQVIEAAPEDPDDAHGEVPGA